MVDIQTKTEYEMRSGLAKKKWIKGKTKDTPLLLFYYLNTTVSQSTPISKLHSIWNMIWHDLP